MRPDFRCTEIVKYYLVVPLKRDHPSYEARFQMHRDSKIQLSCPSQRVVVTLERDN
jgi:hypothetical protein